MLSIISPAKKLDEAPNLPNIELGSYEFQHEASALINELQKYSKQDISALMGLSDKLSELNYNRYQNFEAADSFPAIYHFKGDVYGGIDIDNFPEDKLANLGNHVAILSGLYGLLRPFDLIKPYRLEMGTKLAIGNYKNLYEFWGSKIAEAINVRADEVGASYILNLASNEYFKSVKIKEVTKPIITADFKEKKGDSYKTIGIHAKRARGLFARFVALNEITDKADLLAFNAEDYSYNKDLSSQDKLIFTR